MKKLIAVLAALVLTVTSPPQVAYAATVVTFDISRGLIKITDSTYSGYNSSGTKLSGSSSGMSFVITGTTTTNEVIVSGTQNITLSNCSIDVSSTGSSSSDPGDAAFRIIDDNTGNVNVILVGNNALKSGFGRAGLEKNGDTSTGTLTISGTGSLTTTGGVRGAGIGGGSGGDGSNITINGGTVTAIGSGAGIGGGDGSNITINGGTVTAIGGDYDAGIGSSRNNNGSNITITGGNVTATGGEAAAGIGGGYKGSGSKITISGGTVKAVGRDWGVNGGAGIGGGCGNGFSEGDGSYITISGGTVTATAGHGAGIGSGSFGTASHIVISGGSVKAVTDSGLDAIGLGYKGKGYGAAQPTDGKGHLVYLNTISNPGSKPVYINGVSYTPVNHTAADPADANLYVYLPDTDNKIQVITTEITSISLSSTSVNYGAPAPTLSVTGTWSSLSYSSSNMSVATINSSGIITVKGAGTATFTVKAS